MMEEYEKIKNDAPEAGNMFDASTIAKGQKHLAQHQAMPIVRQ